MKKGVCLLVVLSFVSLAFAANVSYVPNALCATPNGCDFNGNIWNIVGAPSAGDAVTVASDVPITIFANNANIALASLMMANTGAAITFILTNSTLDVTGTVYLGTILGTNVPINVSSLVLYSSNVQASWIIADRIISDFANVTTIVNAFFAYANVNQTIFNYTGGFSMFNTAFASECSFTGAGQSLFFSGVLYADDCLIDVNTFYPGNITVISNSPPLYINDLIMEENDYFVFQNTQVHLGYLSHAQNDFVSFETDNPNNTFTIDQPQYVIAGLNSTVHLGSGVTAIFGAGPFDTLSYTSPVIINFPQDEPHSQTSISNLQTNGGTGISTININNWVFVNANAPVTANFNIFANGTLSAYSQINGNVSGPGLLSIGGSPSFSFVNIGEVLFYSGALSTMQLVASTIAFYTSKTNGTINAQQTIVSSGIMFETNNTLFINGDYTQTGGFLNFTMTANTFKPFITVNGTVTLDSVTVTVESPVINGRMLIISSLTNSSHINVKQVYNPMGNLAYQIVVEGGNTYIVQKGGGSKQSIADYLKDHIYIPIIAGAVFLGLIVLIVVLVKKRGQRKHYQMVK